MTLMLEIASSEKKKLFENMLLNYTKNTFEQNTTRTYKHSNEIYVSLSLPYLVISG